MCIRDRINSIDVVDAVAQQDDHNLKISANGTDALNQIIDVIRHEGGNICLLYTSRCV